MTQNQIVATGIIISLILALFTAIVVEPMDSYMADGFYTFAGFGYIIFGIWAVVLLLKK